MPRITAVSLVCGLFAILGIAFIEYVFHSALDVWKADAIIFLNRQAPVWGIFVSGGGCGFVCLVIGLAISPRRYSRRSPPTLSATAPAEFSPPVHHTNIAGDSLPPPPKAPRPLMPSEYAPVSENYRACAEALWRTALVLDFEAKHLGSLIDSDSLAIAAYLDQAKSLYKASCKGTEEKWKEIVTFSQRDGLSPRGPSAQMLMLMLKIVRQRDAFAAVIHRDIGGIADAFRLEAENPQRDALDLSNAIGTTEAFDARHFSGRLFAGFPRPFPYLPKSNVRMWYANAMVLASSKAKEAVWWRS